LWCGGKGVTLRSEIKTKQKIMEKKEVGSVNGELLSKKIGDWVKQWSLVTDFLFPYDIIGEGEELISSKSKAFEKRREYYLQKIKRGQKSKKKNK